MLQWRHLAETFIFIKMISHIRFIFLVNQLVFLSLLIPTKLTITKIHHLIRSKFEQSEHKKSQCALAFALLILTASKNKYISRYAIALRDYGVVFHGTFLHVLFLLQIVLLMAGDSHLERPHLKSSD